MSVAPLTQEDALELFAMISVFEGLAAAAAARLPAERRAAIVPELRAINEQLLNASSAERRDVSLVFLLDREFHRSVVEAGAGPRLRSLHASIKPQSERYGRIYSSSLIDQIVTSVHEHEDIVRAIEAGDATAADAAMRNNWANAAARLARVIDTVGEQGAW